MTLNIHQIKQILQYNPDRMYYGTWSAAVLNDYQAEALRNSKPKQLYISDLNNDIICNTLWYEMSYNTERFGKTSPFISNGKTSFFFIPHVEQLIKQSILLKKYRSISFMAIT